MHQPRRLRGIATQALSSPPPTPNLPACWDCRPRALSGCPLRCASGPGGALVRTRPPEGPCAGGRNRGCAQTTADAAETECLWAGGRGSEPLRQALREASLQASLQLAPNSPTRVFQRPPQRPPVSFHHILAQRQLLLLPNAATEAAPLRSPPCRTCLPCLLLLSFSLRHRPLTTRQALLLLRRRRP